MIGFLGVKPKALVVIVLSSWLIACSETNSNQASIAKGNTQQTTKLTVSAAASLADTLPPIKELYEQQNPGVSITYNFGSSGSLQRQIQQGAPVDIFISASVNKMDALQKEELLSQNSRKDLVQNKVVLIVPKNNPTISKISNFKDLTRAEVQKISIGEPQSVPAGKYAKEVLTNAGIFKQLESKTVFAKNVRQVLTYVETGNVDAGIVYATDAKNSDQVKIATVASANSHSPVVYPVAVIKDSKNPTVAKEFVEFLSRNSANEVFEKYGFTPVNHNSSKK